MLDIEVHLEEWEVVHSTEDDDNDANDYCVSYVTTLTSIPTTHWVV